MEYLSGQRLEDIITNDITIVDYFAEWCGPCKMLGMELEELEGVRIIKVDTDNHQDLAQEKGIMSIPFVEIYKDKKLITSFIGFKTKDEIEKTLKEI